MNFKSVNLHGYDPGTTLTRNTNDVVGGLISGRPAAIAVQEFGNSLSGDINEKQLLQGMLEQGYDSISAVKPVRNPVNARIFFDRRQLFLASELPPFYKFFLNRQASAIFQIREKKFVFLSLHLPLFEKYPEDKLAMWKSLILFVKHLESLNYFVVVAGDFNENNLKNSRCTSLSNKLVEIGNILKNADEDVPTWKDKRLDHIFVSKSLEIIGKYTRRTSLSDHAEITCEVLL